MPLTLNSPELSQALQAARLAADACRQIYQQLVEVAAKSGREPVTIADYTAQTLINATLRSAFPADSILAEEHGSEFRTVLSAEQQSQVARYASGGLGQSLNSDDVQAILSPSVGTSGRTWVIDPIDGTKGFMAKRAYAVTIALLDGSDIVLGVLACPNLSLTQVGELSEDGVLFYAVRSQGAYHEALTDGERHSMRVSSNGPSDPLNLLTSVESGHSNKDLFGLVVDGLPSAQKQSIGLDGQGKYGLVANGSAEAYFRLVPEADYREKVWDHAAGVIIVEEAGGQVSDFAGRPLDFSQGRKLASNRGVVVSNGHLHPALLEAIARTKWEQG
jgi:3'(2'), 5'-bisphosphate nucleotidase